MAVSGSLLIVVLTLLICDHNLKHNVNGKMSARGAAIRAGKYALDAVCDGMS